ncbi:unnamed protein product [Phytophthora lilii]|uniref:Unnamed protein product n=1 Tax=Phytophthora lilii TaxID=2077276 RepID=A0A9W7D9S0_9STRA|nr:unnamed protein product [Phytophthora lilii]
MPDKSNLISQRSLRKPHLSIGKKPSSSFHVQVVIDGTTEQTNQVHENVNTFKAITETDYTTYVKHGPTSNFVLDEYSTPTIQGSSGAAQALDNLATSSFMTATNSIGEFGMASNRGAAE